MVAVNPENMAMGPPSESIMELSFLIPRTQFAALEQAAQHYHMSVAQYLRRIVQFSLIREANTPASAWEN